MTHAAPWSAAYLSPEKRTAYRPTTRGRLYWLEEVDVDGPAVTGMIDALARHRVAVDPTLIALHTKFWAEEPRYRRHPDFGLVPQLLRDQWRRTSFTDGWSADDYRRGQAAWPTVQALIRRLYEAGVPLTIGSDLPNPWVIPGVSFHEEMLLLHDAGLPAAAVLGLDAERGTVEAGQRADLVVLSADQLRDLHNTRAIEWVLAGGRRYRPSELLATPPTDTPADR